MPIYEYLCPVCGGIREVLVSPGEQEESIQCDGCGNAEMERILSVHSAPRTVNRPKGLTCCGSEERCSTPPCSTGGTCRRS